MSEPKTPPNEAAMQLAQASLKRIEAYVNEANLGEYGYREPEGKLCLELLEDLINTTKLGSLSPFDRRCADALADEVDILVGRHVLDQRSPAADALLDYRNIPRSQRSARMLSLTDELERVRAQLETLRGAALNVTTDAAQDMLEDPQGYYDRLPYMRIHGNAITHLSEALKKLDPKAGG